MSSNGEHPTKKHLTRLEQDLLVFIRAHGVGDLLEVVKGVCELEAIPPGTSGSTDEGARCYVAASALDDVLSAVEAV